MKPSDFQHVYRRFSAPIAARFDCGKFCAPLNGGEPVCCTTAHAVPIATRAEWDLLRGRTDLWRRFRPFDGATRKIVEDLPRSCTAIECKGAAFCERDNRTLACRAFPFYPYFTRERELVGVSVYWGFEDRCWVVSNLWVAERRFVRELIAGYEYLFARDEEEEDAYVDQSVQARRIFSRRGRVLPVLGRGGGFLKVLPKSGGRLVKASRGDFKAYSPYKSQHSYERAVREEGGESPPRLPKRK